MKTLCIKTNNKKIIKYLLDSFTHINLEYVYVSNNSFKNFDNVIVHYTGTNLDVFYDEFTKILVNCILFFYEDKIINNLIDFNYFYFNDIEKKNIQDLTKNSLKNFDENSNAILTQTSIYNSILTYIKDNKSLILDGFVNFRLKNYIKIIDNLVDEAVNSFLIEREYNEFIQILKMYVSSSASQISTVHLIYSNSETILLDENKDIIPTDSSIFKAKYLSDISFSSNDYALNTLLNLIPEKLIIHLIDGYSDEFIKTLQLIFENRVSVLQNCYDQKYK